MRWIVISLLLLLPTEAMAACTTTGCWRIWVMARWDRQVIDGTITNDISVNQTYPGKCSAIRDLSNVGPTLLDGTINAEIWECEYDDANKQLIDADPDYLILTGDRMSDTSSCSDPAYDNQGDCETVDYACVGQTGPGNNQGQCEGNGGQWVGTQRGVWTVSEDWVPTLRPRNEAITSPEFSAVRNKMTSLGWNTNGVDSCVGQNANGRTRQEILDTVLDCIGQLQ